MAVRVAAVQPAGEEAATVGSGTTAERGGLVVRILTPSARRAAGRDDTTTTLEQPGVAAEAGYSKEGQEGLHAVVGTPICTPQVWSPTDTVPAVVEAPAKRSGGGRDPVRRAEPGSW